MRDRVAVETRHIIGSGYGTLLAAAKLADFSAGRGYPVGIRGLIGNLYVAHLLGIVAVDPLGQDLCWESCLGLDGDRMPVITMNVTPELLEDMTAYLAEILPGYAPGDEKPAIGLCPDQLMGLAEKARRQAGTHLRHKDIFAEDMIGKDAALSGLFLETLDSINYLYPRGQCADYLYWALTLLWYQQ